MHTSIRTLSKQILAKSIIAGAALTFLFSGCATAPSGPNPPDPNPPNSTSVDQFFNLPPSTDPDNFYLLLPGENQDDFSFFLDEQDFQQARDNDDDGDHFAHDLFSRGHHYGWHDHDPNPFPPGHHGRIFIGVRFVDWTDSLQLTDLNRLAIDTAIREFLSCADSTIDSFRVALVPARDSFKVQRAAIIAKLDSGSISRDSARHMLDSAIARYETATAKLNANFLTEIKVCLNDLDAYIKAHFTLVQYNIWIRHRGW